MSKYMTGASERGERLPGTLDRRP